MVCCPICSKTFVAHASIACVAHTSIALVAHASTACVAHALIACVAHASIACVAHASIACVAHASNREFFAQVYNCQSKGSFTGQDIVYNKHLHLFLANTKQQQFMWKTCAHLVTTTSFFSSHGPRVEKGIAGLEG